MAKPRTHCRIVTLCRHPPGQMDAGYWPKVNPIRLSPALYSQMPVLPSGDRNVGLSHCALMAGRWDRGDYMSRYARRHEEEDAKINLTPMLDVVFMMLIFFVVTATFVKEVGLEVNQPEDNRAAPDARDHKIVVRITSRDRILIARRDVDWRAVRANIERMHAEYPEAPVIIQPHPDSRTETMVHVMDSARKAGVVDVSLATGG